MVETPCKSSMTLGCSRYLQITHGDWLLGRFGDLPGTASYTTTKVEHLNYRQKEEERPIDWQGACGKNRDHEGFRSHSVVHVLLSTHVPGSITTSFYFLEISPKCIQFLTQHNQVETY